MNPNAGCMLRTIGVLCMGCQMAAVAGEGESLTLCRDGASDCVIAIPPQATAVEQTAAAELRDYLARVTGATLPLISQAQAPADTPRIVVGDGPLTRRLLPDVQLAALAPDTIIMRTVGRDLVLCGHPRRGTLLAAITFLEDVVGVRWWTMTETFVPARPTLAIPTLAVSYTPPVLDRATRYLELSDGCFTNHKTVTPEEQRAMGVFASRLRLNGHDLYTIPPERGGANGLLGWVHTFYQINGLLPPGKHFKDHPEWYSLVDGKRRDANAQLCLTNEDMRAEMVRVVLERLRANPDATMISVSQNDWRGNCECDCCRALDEQEGTPAGSLIHFINAVAEQVEKEFPNVLIETLAYHYTRVPPKHVRARRNVVVRLCNVECDFSKPLTAEVEANRRFRENIEAWSQISPQLYIWDYVTNFRNYLLPHPNFHVLAPNLRFFVKHHAIGIFEQGDSGCRVGDFVRLRAWYLAHLLWNPDADEKALLAEFMNGYYGAAAPHLTAYIHLMSEAGLRATVPVGCFMASTEGWLTLDDMNQAMTLFERALTAVVHDPVLSERVRRERLPLDHAWLQGYDMLKRQAVRRNAPFLGPPDPEVALCEFITLVRKHRVGEIRQGRAFPEDFGNDLRFRLAKTIPPGPVPEHCAGLARDAWFELQDADYIPRDRKELVAIVKDPAASNGLTRRMPNTHTVWACHSYPLVDYGVRDESRWHVTLSVRCEAATDEGEAMTVGVYDDAQRRAVASKTILVRDIRGSDYTTIDLGVLTLAEQTYVWAAPVVRAPDEATAVYVDRVVFVRQP
ncbi:MAG: DUF4838 domain-containing protein [Planctomycetes bacterium]|nr:DUF4838 domain-containing protein [Planctomycetota bacterium]